MSPIAMTNGPTSQPGSAYQGTYTDHGVALNTSQPSPHNPNSASSSSIEDLALSSKSPSPSPNTTPGSSSTAPPSPIDPIDNLVPSSSPSSIKEAKQKIKTKRAKKKQQLLKQDPSSTSVTPSIELSDFSSPNNSTSPVSSSSPTQAPSSPDGSNLAPPSPAASSSIPSASTIHQRLPRSSTWESIRSRVPNPTLPSANNSLALLALAVSAFGLLFFGYRAYKMQIVDLMNGYVQNCYSWQGQQQGMNHMSKRCQAMLKMFESGEMEPPYALPKRDLSHGVKTLVKRGLAAAGTAITARGHAMSNATGRGTESSYAWLLKHKSTLGTNLVTCVVLIFGTTVVIRQMQQRLRREAPPFRSPARSELRDIRVTRCFDDGEPEEVMQEQGYRIINHNPEEHHYLGRLRQMIRDAVEGPPAQASNVDDEGMNTELESEMQHPNYDNENLKSMSEMVKTWFKNDETAETLTVGDERHGSNSSGRSMGSQMSHGFPSKVHLHHRQSVSGPSHGYEEHRENLIELPAKGKTKNFFDPNTGEFIHLVPWSSHGHTGFYEDDDQRSDDEDKAKGEAKQKFVQMTTGGAALAGGKVIDAMFLKEMERLGAAAVASGAETRDSVTLMLVGDCFGGLFTRWRRRAMPQVA